MRSPIPAILFAALGLGAALLLEGQAVTHIRADATRGDSVPTDRSPATGTPDSISQSIRRDHHVVRRDALHLRREEERIAALERRSHRLRAIFEQDQRDGRTSRLEEDRELLRQAEGALALERGRLARP